MILAQCKCKKCNTKSLDVDYIKTVEAYSEEYSKDIKTVLPYSNPPLSPNFFIMTCSNCEESFNVSHEEAIKMLRDDCSELAWVRSRVEIGTPEYYENYLEKYIIKKGLHKNISKEDRDSNPYLDRLLKHVEEKHIKKCSN